MFLEEKRHINADGFCYEPCYCKHSDDISFSQHRGLVARLLSCMFAEKANRRKVSKIEYYTSFVELYGKEARDLLASDVDNNKVKINEREPFKVL